VNVYAAQETRIGCPLKAADFYLQRKLDYFPGAFGSFSAGRATVSRERDGHQMGCHDLLAAAFKLSNVMRM
jgi:hypothetical protein